MLRMDPIKSVSTNITSTQTLTTRLPSYQCKWSSDSYWQKKLEGILLEQNWTYEVKCRKDRKTYITQEILVRERSNKNNKVCWDNVWYFLFCTLLPMTVRFWYKLVAKWPWKPAHSNWINLSVALQGQLWRPWKSGRILMKHLEAIPLEYLKHTSFWGVTNVASRRGALEKPQKMLWAPIGEVFCIPLRLVFYSNISMEYYKPNQPFSWPPW